MAATSVLTKPTKRQTTKKQRTKLPELWKHQKRTVLLCRKEKRVLDTSDPGTGKTRSHIVAYDEIRKKHGGKCLIIAPKTLMEPAWDEDIKKYAPHLTTSVAYAENREDAFKEDVDVYITNTDAVKWLAKQPKRFFKDFSTLIIDEIQYYKHRTSQRSRAIKKIRVYFDYRRGLGATITSNTICDLWHPMFILDDGKRLGTIFSSFRSAVSVPEQVGPRANHIKWVDREGAEQAVTDLIKSVSIRHEFEKVMDIPENRQYSIQFTLNKMHMRKYQKLAATAVVELEKETISAVNAAVLRSKLLQLASGAVYGATDSYEVVDTKRYDLIADLIEARKHSVVFFNWKHQRDQLVAAMEKRGIMHCVIDGTTPQKRRKELVDAYQTGFFQTMFLHPKTGAHGLTLTTGTSTIWCSPIYEADFLKQGTHRIYRGGQDKKTETILIEAKDTVEPLVFARLGEKTDRMMNFLDILKEAT
jgi:SNF2 family DNA or RNA helicase